MAAHPRLQLRTPRGGINSSSLPWRLRRTHQAFFAALVWLLPCGLAVASPPPIVSQEGQPANRRPLTPHVAKIDVSTAEFSIRTDAAGDYVIRYRDLAGKPVKVVYEPSNKVLMTLAAKVETDTRGNFTFLYEPANAANSPQPVDGLVVEFQGVVLGVKAPAGWTGEHLATMSAMDWHLERFEGPGLRAGKRLPGFAMSAAVEPVSEKPALFGKEGFSHFQGALPGIVNCHATGEGGILIFPDEPPQGLEDNFPFFPQDGVGGRTVGPVVLPVDGQIPWLLERLRSYAQESHELGWLVASARLQKYLLFLDEVGRYLEAKSFVVAQQLLVDFRRQVELDFKLGFLTSEAYALLFHNSLYLEKLLAES